MSCFSFASTVGTGTTSGGALSQLIALGAMDTSLSAFPDVTFWRLRVQKCTNYSMESIIQGFTGTVSWGSEVSITLNRTGDLLSFMYVLIDIPGICAVTEANASQFPYDEVCGDPCGDGLVPAECCVQAGNCPTSEFLPPLANDDPLIALGDCDGATRPFAHWVDEIGFAALQRVSFSVGGHVIDTVYNHYLHMWEELSGQPGKRLQEMIGKRYTKVQLIRDSQKPRRLYVPLPFYFTRHSGNAFPLVSIQFHTMQLQVGFAPLVNLIQVSDQNVKVVKCNGAGVVSNVQITPQDMGAYLDTTYVYLDMEERDRFAVGSFQQLITQVQQYETVIHNTSGKINPSFNHPSLEMIWAVQRNCKIKHNYTFDYSGKYGIEDPICRVSLKLNNLPRFDREAQYFRLVQPYQHHTNIPNNYVYCYSFALFPEDCNPSGTLNMSRIDNLEMTFFISPNLQNEDLTVRLYDRNFNILRYREGLGGLLYAT